MQEITSLCVQRLRSVPLCLTSRQTHTHTHRQHCDQFIWTAQTAELISFTVKRDAGSGSQ